MSDLLTALEQLVEQAAHAEQSIGGKLVAARYTSLREVRFESRGQSVTVNMFAVSVDGRDIMLCRSPELGKMMGMLLPLGDKLIAQIMQAMRREKNGAIRCACIENTDPLSDTGGDWRPYPDCPDCEGTGYIKAKERTDG